MFSYPMIPIFFSMHVSVRVMAHLATLLGMDVQMLAMDTLLCIGQLASVNFPNLYSNLQRGWAIPHFMWRA